MMLMLILSEKVKKSLHPSLIYVLLSINTFTFQTGPLLKFLPSIAAAAAFMQTYTEPYFRIQKEKPFFGEFLSW